MNSLIAFFAPLALLLPAAGAPVKEEAQLDPRQAELLLNSGEVLSPQAFDAPVQRQVRIERRVIVRIAPRSSRSRANLVADVQRPNPSTRFVERKIGKCIPLKSIGGVQTWKGNKLVLYLRDRRIITAKLEKSCSSRDFYSGFYVEKDKDGNLCADRDELLSRSGAKCEVERLRQLIAVSK